MTTYNKYKALYNKHGIWELWHDKEWPDLEDDFYRTTVKGFSDREAKENILLYGVNGSGKTMAMNLAMKDLLHKGKEVYVIDFRNLVKEYIKSWRDEGIMGMLMKVDYLAIDDLGKEFNSGEVSKELAITTLDYVLRYRVQRERPTWMTFNLMLGDIEPAYNKHIASLIKRSSISVAFEGADYGEGLFRKITK